VSKQELPLIQSTATVQCCSPLVREPLSAPQAVELARVFKAMGDPVRLRLLSLIASHEGGARACLTRRRPCQVDFAALGVSSQKVGHLRSHHNLCEVGKRGAT
jgi:DNA-binding transcriptional ArsR family regulator